MKNHDLIDKRSLELAKAVAGKIDMDPERSGLVKAKKSVLDGFKFIRKNVSVNGWTFLKSRRKILKKYILMNLKTAKDSVRPVLFAVY